MSTVVAVLTKTEWPYTKVQRKTVELQPGQKIAIGDGWIIAEVRHGAETEPFSSLWPETALDWSDADQAEQPAAEIVEPGWKTWPPTRELEVGHEYLVRTKTGAQRHAREMRASYLGIGGPGSDEYLFNARPAFGTQSVHANMIMATKDLGKSQGRDDSRRYCNKVIR